MNRTEAYRVTVGTTELSEDDLPWENGIGKQPGAVTQVSKCVPDCRLERGRTTIWHSGLRGLHSTVSCSRCCRTWGVPFPHTGTSSSGMGYTTKAALQKSSKNHHAVALTVVIVSLFRFDTFLSHLAACNDPPQLHPQPPRTHLVRKF